jgi:23S rRNA pseudouridine1911/1915/1917 synthase
MRARAVIVLTPADGTPRLDALLRLRLPHVSRRNIRSAIAAGIVTVNGRRRRKAERLGPGDRVNIGALVDQPPAPEDLHVRLLYSDAAILALDKPAGLPATARRVGGKPSIAGYLLRRFPDLADVGASPLEAGLVHRLDTATSGVLVAARSRAGWLSLRAQFRRHTVHKEYLALVHGRLRGERDLSHALAHDPRARRRMLVVPPRDSSPARGRLRSWRAIARVVPIASRRDMTLVRVGLTTGVTHQIRAQLAAIGHPIVGDAEYGRRSRVGLLIGRHLLHARAVRLQHPTTHRTVRLWSLVPAEFANVLTGLGLPVPAKRSRGLRDTSDA